MGWDRALAVVAGGALGALIRYLTSVLTSPWTRTFPWSTLGINVLGCLAIGILQPLVRERQLLLVFLVPGVLGGFTTFSAFGHETYELADRGAVGLAAVYVALSVGLGLGAVWLGRVLIK
jgi:CrcB protein